MIRNIIVVLMLLISIGAGFAVSEPETYCMNQEGDYFCSSVDTSCTYHESGVQETADTDSDGWTDSCDAFEEDADEWFDLDGDGCGSNEDENDLDPSINDCVDDTPEPEVEIKEDEPEDMIIGTSSPNNKGSGRKNSCVPDWSCSDWSQCADDEQSRDCVDLHGCVRLVDSPQVTRSCTSKVVEVVMQNISIAEIVEEDKTQQADLDENTDQRSWIIRLLLDLLQYLAELEEKVLPENSSDTESLQMNSTNQTNQSANNAQGNHISFAPIMILMIFMLIILILLRRMEQGDVIL